MGIYLWMKLTDIGFFFFVSTIPVREHVAIGRSQLSGSRGLRGDAAHRSLLRHAVRRQRSRAAGTRHTADENKTKNLTSDPPDVTVRLFSSLRSEHLPPAVDFQSAVAAKLSVSLLRHTELIPADKAFYEAGLSCRVSPPPGQEVALPLRIHILESIH